MFDHPKIPDLPQARAGIDAVGELLIGDLCGWPPGRVASLPDISDPPQLAVRIRDLVRDADDVLLVYYVGHGIRTSEGQLALALRETDPDPEVLAHTGMLYESLAKILRGCRARTKLVILDCCHAELGHKANYIFQSADLAEAYPVDGLYFIGASARDKKARAPADGKLTYFTQAFLDVIHAGIPIPNPTLRLDQIFLELRRRLAEANLPIPVEAGTRGAHQFPFALNATPMTHDEFGQLIPIPAIPSGGRLQAGVRRRRLLLAAGSAAVAAAVGGVAYDLASASHALPGSSSSSTSSTSNNTPTLTPTNRSFATPALLNTLTGHTAFVNRVAIAGNGQFLASGSGDETAKIWDVTDPLGAALQQTLTGHTGIVYGVAWSPDGTMVATSSGDTTVRLWASSAWRSAQASTIALLRGHSDAVISVAISPEGKKLATASWDKTAKLWDISDPTNPALLATIRGHTDRVNDVAFHPDGTLLATGSYDSTARLWNIAAPAKPSTTAVITSHLAVVAGVAFSPVGSTLGTASYDNTAKLWNVNDPASPGLLATLAGHTNGINGMGISGDGTMAATAAYDDTVKLWDTAALGKPMLDATLTGSSHPELNVAFAPNGRVLYTADGGRNTVRLWEV
jgi:hypothetical protein